MRASTLLLGILLGGCLPRYGGEPPLSAAELWAPRPTSRVVVGDVGMSVLDTGGDGPVLLLIHGLSSYSSFWEYQVEPLAAAGFRVLAVDLPGFGASDKPDAPYTPPWYADQLDGLLSKLGVERATLIGHSMGGQVAITYALAHPDRTERLVLAAPAGIERFSPGEAAWMRDYFHEERALESGEEAIRANFHAVFNRWDEGVERLVSERVRVRDTADFAATSVAVSRCVAGMLDHPVADRLGELAVPTLIVFGTDDRLIPNPVYHGGRTAGVGKAGAAAIPGAQLVLVSGAGHAVFHDDPTRFNDAVLAFLGGA